MIGFIGTSITITINYTSSQSRTVNDSLHLLLDCECLPFCMTDLVLIYELATSWASVVRWLTLHSWTLKYWTAFCILRWMNLLNWVRVVESYVTTDGQSASLSWNKAPIWGLRPDFYFRTEYGIRLTVMFLILWGALSDERTGLSFVCAAGPCQRSFLGS
jgi:hypothetical protein